MRKPLITALILSAVIHIAAACGVSMLSVPRAGQIAVSMLRMEVEIYRPPQPAVTPPVSEIVEIITTAAPSEYQKSTPQPKPAEVFQPELVAQQQAVSLEVESDPVEIPEQDEVRAEETLVRKPDEILAAAARGQFDQGIESEAVKAQTDVIDAPDGFRLIEMPVPVSELPRPKYPYMAERMGYEGTVILMVQLNEKGKVINVTVDKPSGHRILDQAAVKTGRTRWRFRPQIENGIAIRAEFLVPVEFKRS